MKTSTTGSNAFEVDDMKIALIPARGGSKSIPLKNIRNFCGRPLIYWVLEAAEKSRIDQVYVATDSEEIAQAVNSFGFSKVKVYDRDPENAQDSSSTESVMLEFIEKQKLTDEIFILIQATSPFLTAEDLDGGLKEFEKHDSLLSVVKFKRFLWGADGKPVNYDYKNRPRRQDCEGSYLENGAFYINLVKNIKKDKNRLSGDIGLLEMPEYSQIEIDEPDDWAIAEATFRKKQSKRMVIGKEIKLVLSDVDGTLTDGGTYCSENGEMLSKFSRRDGMGFELLRKKGFKVGIITKEKSKIVETRARKLNLDIIEIGIENKRERIESICKEHGVSWDNVAYIGDDINDLEVLEMAGISACPKDAVQKVKEKCSIVLDTKGGKGAFRELADMLL
jgi:N-acylneuraminate cytidylyltransferase